MASVSTNIAQLLYEYECVVVPGFGGFVTNYRAANIDDSGKAVPPTCDLDFVDKLTFNDGVLVNRLAEQNGRSYQEAISSIETYTRNCTKALYQQQPVYLHKVGEIQADSAGNLQFEAENTNFLSDAFGLPVLDLKPIKSVTATQESVKIIPTPAPVTPQTKNMAKSSFNLFNILLLATLLFAAYYVWDRYKANKFTTKPRTETKIPVHKEEEFYEEDVSDADNEEFIDYTGNLTVIKSDEYIEDTPTEVKTTQEPVRVITETPVVKTTRTPTTTTKSKPKTRSYGTKRYVIVVGSFGDGGNAKRMINECRRQGYETTTSWSGSMKRVGVVVNCTKNQLSSKLNQVQNRLNSSAWVMK